ncbi:hypothetical protein F5X71_34845 [Nocardia brasiliensis]|uniref:Uncharacterized protein n=1 Tax=Nocardia brasiliensis TaxID=37326 RepID=A0A6G9Y0V9_NOCBR|nr:hypothetical protein [Nocardia brasiliensis]QIS06804.1 hypothetical protein F5X71_34845 [Nocardia brasiliensis]
MSTTAMPKSVTTGDVARKILELARESPGFVYEPPPRSDDDGVRRCVYVADVNGVLVGSCLVGRALIALGFAPQQLTDRSKSAWMMLSYLGIRTAFSDPINTPYWINDVQRNQDHKHTWSEAVDIASARFPRVVAELTKAAV